MAFYAGTACKISLLPTVAKEVFDAAPAEARIRILVHASRGLTMVGPCGQDWLMILVVNWSTNHDWLTDLLVN